MHVLRRSPALARLVAAETISPLGDAMATVAVILHLQAEGGTGTTVAAILFAEAIPPVLSPLAGAVADRVRDRRTLIVAGAVLQAAVIAATAVALPHIGLLALATLLFVRAAIDTASAPALGSIVPEVVDVEDLPAANGIVASAREVGTIVGPPLAGVLFALSNASWALGVDAFTFLCIVPLIAGLRVSTTPPAGDEEPLTTWRTDITEGMRLIWHTPILRAISIGFWVSVFFTAPDDLVIPFLARDEFNATPVAIGITMAGASVGLVLAAPFVASVSRRFGTVVGVIVAGGLITATGNLLTAAAPILGLAFLGQAIRGSGIALFDAAGVRTLIQREVPARLMGRAFANIYGGVGVAAALGYLPGGPFLDATSPRIAFAVIGTGGLAGIVLTYVLLRRARAHA